jgi:hypothetical protein
MQLGLFVFVVKKWAVDVLFVKDMATAPIHCESK